ncbi:MAG: hypothetical protein KKF42_08160 [Actinobacteria bacterium]|nr:hypothetical protein [Actinomycetota bacterium]
MNIPACVSVAFSLLALAFATLTVLENRLAAGRAGRCGLVATRALQVVTGAWFIIWVHGRKNEWRQARKSVVYEA